MLGSDYKRRRFISLKIKAFEKRAVIRIPVYSEHGTVEAVRRVRVNNTFRAAS